MTKQEKVNLWCYPLGTVGRDMVYSLFTNYIMLFVLYTRELTVAQLAAVTGIMVGARIFDALNDPIMGNIIERTRGRFGKFKPWMIIGIATTSFVVYMMFNTNLQGWNFIIFFGIAYFLYSITYTMHDISYWGMVTALSKEGQMRDKITSRASLFAGAGGTIASIFIPMLTAGAMAIGGNSKTAYGRVALIVCILAPLFMLFTLVCVKENRDDMNKPAPKVSFKKICTTIVKNDQLLWMCFIFLIQETGSGLAIGGIGSNYIYFEFGYNGGLYSLFSTVGMAATAILMIVYPAIVKRLHRKKMAQYLCLAGIIGYGIMLLAGLLLPTNMIKFWVITIGFMASNLGQYGLYLIMMISIFNTVEYNELRTGNRDEAIITSMRPFLTKFASSLTVLITSVSYMSFRITSVTNQISDLERSAEQGLISVSDKANEISTVIGTVAPGQKIGLLAAMTVVPCLLIMFSNLLYQKKYKIDEAEYDRICKELEVKKA